MAMMVRILVILGLKKKNYPDLLARAWAMYNAFLAKPELFITINVALLLTKIKALDTAQQAIATKAKGTIPTRNLAAAALVTTLETNRALVQELVDASPDEAAYIIEAAAMFSKRMREYAKPVLAATQSQPGGLVALVVNVAQITTGIKGKVFFNWESSNDGKTWTAAPSTPHGNTTFAGLTPGVTYSFRACVTARGKTTTWSDAVTLLVR